MKVTKKSPSHKKRTLYITLCVVVFAVAGYMAVAYTQSLWPFTSRTDTNTQTAPQDSDASTKKSPDTTGRDGTATDDGAKKKQELLDNPATPTTPPTPTSSSIEISSRTDGANAVITTKLHDITSGTCTLTATNGSKSLTRTAEIMYAPDHATCAGFSVPTAELGTGTWTISISAKTANTTVSNQTTLEVK